jgi:uncharacterized SAM-dependent methyltransferase
MTMVCTCWGGSRGTGTSNIEYIKLHADLVVQHLPMEPHIIDVRENITGDSSPSNAVLDAIVNGLSKPAGSRSLPTLLLYDERGLRLYDDITTKAPEYYLFGCEEQILSDHADDIVRAMRAAQRDSEVVIELGAG